MLEQMFTSGICAHILKNILMYRIKYVHQFVLIKEALQKRIMNLNRHNILIFYPNNKQQGNKSLCVYCKKHINTHTHTYMLEIYSARLLMYIFEYKLTLKILSFNYCFVKQHILNEIENLAHEAFYSLSFVEGFVFQRNLRGR